MGNVDVQDASEEKTVAEAATNESETQTSTTTAEQPVAAPTLAAAPTRKKLSLNVAKISRRTVLEALLVVVIVVLGLWAWTLSSDNSSLNATVKRINNDPQIAVQQQTKDLLNKVGSLMQLPADETPTIAAVSDAAKAKKQSAFFANAENGDKVLMYVKAGQAILYRPSTNKIVIVAPLTFSKGTPTSTSPKTTDTNTKN